RDRRLDRRLRHAVLAGPAERAARVLWRLQVRPEQLRDDVFLERVPHRLRRLARVPRLFRRDALAPARDPLRLRAADDAGLMRLARAARLVRELLWHAHDEQLDALQFHLVAGGEPPA